MMLHLSSLLLAATLGQAPAEPAWLDMVPAEADVVVRVRGVEPVRKDLVAMLKAMSPTLAAQAEPALEQLVTEVRTNIIGEAAAAESLLGIVRFPTPRDPAEPPVSFTVVVRAANQDAFVKAVAGGNAPTLKNESEGVGSFESPKGGHLVYVAKRGDHVAIGTDKVLAASFAKPGSASFTKGLSSASKARFAAGDIGICVNVVALATRYADQITKAKEGFMAALDQVGKQGGQAGMMDMAKSMYGGMFDSIKEADVLILGLDFAAEGLGVDGELAVKADSDAAKSIAASKGSDAKSVAKLPADAAYFLYMNLDPKSFEGLQMMGLKMMTGGKPSPELEAALAKQRGLGRIEAVAAVSMAGGMRSINVMNVSDPKALLATTETSVKAMTAADSPLNFFKDVKVVPNAETYKGYTFTRTDMVIDKDKFAKLQPNNPAAGATLTAMYGGDKITSWYGVNETQMIQLMDKTWDSAKAQLDAYLSGEGSVGATPGYKAVRAKLPTQVNFLSLVSVQGLVNQLAGQFSAMSNNPNLKPPADMPKEPAIVGVSLSAVAPRSYEFHLIVPSPVGAVIEKGLVPMIQSLRGPGN